ncbi:MAG: helix-turn-helix domain-containing protein [Planctomycetota bacterium]|nr:helix-turn-helix domain-containing protein [Planctomycetota bacterium]
MVDLGTTIRIIRQANGLKLTELAKASGLSVPFLSLVEHGRKQLSLSALRKVAVALDVPPEVLVVLAEQNVETKGLTNKRIKQAVEDLISAECNLRKALGISK